MAVFKRIDNTKRHTTHPSCILDQTKKSLPLGKVALHNYHRQRRSSNNQPGSIDTADINTPTIQDDAMESEGSCRSRDAVAPMTYRVSSHLQPETSYESPLSQCSPVPLRNSSIDSLAQPNVMTPYSAFPSRILPLPCTKPTTVDMDNSGAEFRVGQSVRVRRFDLAGRSWSSPGIGVVRRVSRIRGYLGSHARAYVVAATFHGSSVAIEDTYSPFMGEICGTNEGFLKISSATCWERRQRLDWVYALIPYLKDANTNDRELIWQPASVVSSIEPESFRVAVLSGRLKGETFDVDCLHPYNDSTRNALHFHGYHVMDEGGIVLEPPKAQ